MNLGLHLVHFPRSNPALERHVGKARFLQSKNVDCGINSEAVYAAKATSVAVFLLQNHWPVPKAFGMQTLLLQRAVKKFAK